MSKIIRWGILGPGKIARKFASDLLLLADTKIVAVGSRSLENARNFALEFNIANYYGSYSELVQDPNVDVIYVASPHSFHHEHTLLCLSNGKHVLCEKPIGVNSIQLVEMIEAADNNNCFLMEALWTQFLPSFRHVQKIIEDGVIGDIKLIEANFGFNAPKVNSSRIYNPLLAGGALLDVGIYPVFLAVALLGIPDKMVSHATKSDTDIDTTTAIQMKWANGSIAQLHCSINTHTHIDARIYGADKYIVIPRRWHESKTIQLFDQNGLIEEWHFEDNCKGYIYEIEEVNKSIRHGLTQSDIMPLSLSQKLLKTLDNIREQIGLIYPFE
jgi:predicted dehydrogenase